MAFSSRRFFGTLLSSLAMLELAGRSHARDTEYVYGTDSHGVTRQLEVDRYPALYTGDFGDCLGGQSLFNITKFDAAYYADNMTVLFHLDGASNIRNESLMLIITMEAYGETRYTQTFNPCMANMWSLCPLNASVPITGYASFGLGARQLGDIPSIALDIPDFDGFVRLQIFANSSETEIGCFQASMTNGNTFSHPEAVAPILASFALVGIMASFATAIYGVSITHMRTHYAHSLSVLVIFDTFQSVFFSGALSVPWPSALVAWWSNFGWSAGMIYTSSMVHAFGPFAGIRGNASQVGGAGSTVINNNGGLAGQIYGRASIMKRKAYNESDPFDYSWGGNPVTPGMPLPGAYNGFAGELSSLSIPAGDAFLFGLVWLLVAVGLVALLVIGFKWVLEGLVRLRRIDEDRLAYFRSHYKSYMALAVLRTLFIAFFAITTLAVFQIAIRGSPGATAISAIVLAIVLIGLGGAAAYALRSRLHWSRFSIQRDTIVFRRAKFLKFIPCVVPTSASRLKEKGGGAPPARGGLSFSRIVYTDDPSRETVHRDEGYVKRFGWLSARYRQKRWWFFAFYLGYQFFRACFIGGATKSPLVQVYGLFVYEFVAFLVMTKLRPFEGRRNNVLGIWLLGISKVLTAGLSIAFLPAFRLNRILATVIGIVIIVAQAFVVIAVMILAVIGAISSWMSLTRNREDFEPEYLDAIRLRYFERLQAKASGVPIPKKTKQKTKKKKADRLRKRGAEAGPEVPKEPYFAVNSVRRAPKIEDEDGDILADMEGLHNGSTFFDPSRAGKRPSRANSVSSFYSVGSLPRGGRASRTSWTSKDIAEWDASRTDLDRPETALSARLSNRALNSPSDGAVHKVRGPRTSTPQVVRPQTSQHSLHADIARPSSPPPSPSRKTREKHEDETARSQPRRLASTHETIEEDADEGTTAPPSPLTPTPEERPEEGAKAAGPLS